MNEVLATVHNGQVVLNGRLDWPDGTPVVVSPVTEAIPKSMTQEERAAWEVEYIRSGEQLTEGTWPHTPEGLAALQQAWDELEPIVFTDEEQADLAKFWKEDREFQKEAERKRWSYFDDKEKKS